MSKRNWTIFSRIGGKYHIREKIVGMFPNDYNTYVEPFLGGGQVLLELLQNHYNTDIKYVGNDLNKDIYNIWSDFKKVNTTTMKNKDYKGSKQKFNELLNSNPTTPEERLFKNLYLSWYSFGAQRKNYVDKGTIKGQNVIENIDEIQRRLKKVKFSITFL